MSFLSPWYLLGAALIAGPIIFHLIRRSTRDRIEFSATAFLKESPPKLEKRSNVQNPWLLLLRCLIVLLLALSFARPLIEMSAPSEVTDTPSASVAIVIDQSASMQRDGVWEAAISRAKDIVANLDSNDALTIIGIADAPKMFLDFEEWTESDSANRSQLIDAIFDEIKPTHGTASLDTGVLSAMEEFVLSEENLTNRDATVNRIHIISDFSVGSRISALAGRAWTADTTVLLEDVEATENQNIGITWMGWTGLDRNEPAARIAVVSSTNTLDATISLQLRNANDNSPIGEPISVFAPSGQTQMTLLPVPKEETGPFLVQLIGDPNDFDNQVFFIQPQPRNLNIRYFGDGGSDDPQNSAFYVLKASSIWNDPKTALSFNDDPNFSEAPTLHVINRIPSNEEYEKIRASIEKGDSALLLVSNPSILQAARRLSSIEGWTYQASKYEDALLGSIDFESSAFSVFADPRYSDFSKIRFWKPHPFETPESASIRTLARFDDGSIAIASVSIGKGQLIIWGSDWTPQASQWPLSSKFPAWLHNLARQTVGGDPKPQITSFDNLANYLQDGSHWVNPRDADDRTFLPDQPGIYRINSDNGERFVAINTPRREIDVSKIEEDAWEQLGVPLKSGSQVNPPADRADTQAATISKVTEQEQSLWRWIIIATLAFLAFESVIAKLIAQRTERAPS